MYRKSHFLFLVVLLAFAFAIINPIQATVHLPPKMIKSPADIVYEVGTTGHKVIWQYEAHESADAPSNYNITVNGNISVTNERWQDKVDIVFNIDGFKIGEYTVNIIVSDTGVDSGAAAPAKDDVTVTVVEEGEMTDMKAISSTTSESTDFPFAVVLLSIFIMAPLLKRRKKGKN